MIHGPAEADRFRQQVGRYNERWYVDPLPACDIAGTSDDARPSWSTIKGAAGKDWSFVANKRNAAADATELHRIADLDPVNRAKAFNAINDAGLKQAAGRGTILHLWAEDMLFGRAPREITDIDLMAMQLPKAALTEALMYRPALVDFFEAYQPELAAAEYVAICRDLNGIGYGCTPDALVKVQGDLVGIDWKSRTIDSKHSAYPEEGAQIAAGVRADYMIVDDGNGGAKRALLPKVDTGLVVSIKPDGARVYPIDIDTAWRHVEAMHAFWKARQVERDFIGRVWAPKTSTRTKTAAPDSDHGTGVTSGAAHPDNLKTRIAGLIDQGYADALRAAWPFRPDGTPVPTFKAGGHIDGDLDLILAAVRRVERDVSAPFHPDDTQVDGNPQPRVDPQPEVEGSPDEGRTIPAAEVEALRVELAAVPADRLEQITTIARDANAAGHSISVAANPTERRAAIARALIGWGHTSGDIDLLTQQVIVETDPTDADTPLGVLVGRLTIDQAERLASTFRQTAAA